jgi:beta-lactamase class D
VEGAFVLHDPQTGRTVRHNPERSRTRFLPASTFKIPHSLIALETGVAPGPEFTLAWDSTRVPRQAWWPAAWSRSNDLHSAFQNSVVWYYQELARRIGPERMQAHLVRFQYGNQNIGGGIDQFWLQGGLRISPDEQIDFLRRFYTGQLGVSQRSTEIVKKIMVLEETPEYRLSGKTGTAPIGGGTEIAWLVGYVERQGRVYYYALNLQGRGEEVWDRARRVAVTKEILRELGVLPGGGS